MNLFLHYFPEIRHDLITDNNQCLNLFLNKTSEIPNLDQLQSPTIIVVKDIREICRVYIENINSNLFFNRDLICYDFDNNFYIDQINFALKELNLDHWIDFFVKCESSQKKEAEEILVVKYEDIIFDPYYIQSKVFNMLYPGDKNLDTQVIQPYIPESRGEGLKGYFSNLNNENLNTIICRYRWFYEQFYPEVLSE